MIIFIQTILILEHISCIFCLSGTLNTAFLFRHQFHTVYSIAYKWLCHCVSLGNVSNTTGYRQPYSNIAEFHVLSCLVRTRESSQLHMEVRRATINFNFTESSLANIKQRRFIHPDTLNISNKERNWNATMIFWFKSYL